MGQVNELKEFTRGQLDAALMKIGQDADMGTAEGIKAWLRNELVIQRKSLPFSKNEHGHYVFTIIGRNFTGEQEIARMGKGNFRLSGYARQILMSTDVDGYNIVHRLEDGREYKIVLVPSQEIEKNRTTANIQQYARSFDYRIPLAGVVPRIHEAVSDKQIEQMEIRYIACLHMPIKDTDGDPLVFSVGRDDDGRWIGAGGGNSNQHWSGSGAAFAFLAPMS